MVVVCRNPRLEQHRGGRRVVVRWTRGLAVCAWLGSLFSVEGAVQKAAVVDTVVSQRGGLSAPNARGVRRCSLPASAGAAASSPGQTQAGAGSAPVVFVTVRRAGMAVASCVGVCEGPFLRQPHQKGPRGDPAIFGARPVSQQSAVSEVSEQMCLQAHLESSDYFLTMHIPPKSEKCWQWGEVGSWNKSSAAEGVENPNPQRLVVY